MMIRKIAIAILLGIFTTAGTLYGQLTIDIGDQTGSAGGTVDVPLVVNGFTNITTMEFVLSWDPAVMTYNSIVSVGDITDLDEASFGTPPGLDEGNISCSFFNGAGGSSIGNGETMVVFRFNLIGAECDETGFAFNSSAFYSGPDFNAMPLGGTLGATMIDGTDCGGTGGGTDLTCTAAMATGEPGTQICVPVTVQNFEALIAGEGVGSGQGDICWDPAVLTYDGIENNQLPSQFSLNDANTATGSLRFVWFDFGPDTPEIYDDGSTLFEICFTAIGNEGDMSAIDLKDWEWADGTNDNNDIPDVEVDGKVTLASGPVEQFELIVSEVTTDMNERVCVDITTNNFDQIVALEYRVQWDESVLSFGNIAADVVDRNLPGLVNDDMSYIAGANFFTMSWAANSGTDLADGTSLYKVCFDAIGACESSSDVSIVPNNGSNIIVGEEVNGTSQTLPASSISIDNGKVDIECTPMCDVTTVSTMGSCSGEQSGNIVVSVDPAGGTCQWTNAAGTVVGNECNLFGVGPGTYTLTVTQSGTVCGTLTETVGTLTAPSISGTTTPAGCGQGQIIAMVSNAISFEWNPDVGDDLDPMVDAGTYVLTATSTDMCTSSMSFNVTSEIPTLEINPMSTNPSCSDAIDGTIDLNITGGCAPYTIDWTNGLSGENPTNAGNGTYSATITDDKGTDVTTGDITLNTAPLTLADQSIMNSTGSDGSITIDIDGGTEPYSYSWSPAGANSDMITGLAAADYTVIVTDANGCMMTFGPFSVGFIPPGGDSIELMTTDLLCNGDDIGSITANVLTANLPGNLNISGDGVDMTVDVTVSGTTTFDLLGAGDYTVTYTNSNSQSTSATTTINEPNALELTSDIGCENNEQEDGFIDVDVSGGTGALSYNWGIPGEESSSLNNLSVGGYMVIVTDANDCELIEEFDVTDCDGGIDGCYEFTMIITPNNDGQNDVFDAGCLNDFPAELTIYNRWGQMIFNMPSYDGTWAGTGLSGEDLIEGGYMWVLDIDFGNGRRELRKGTVTVLRD